MTSSDFTESMQRWEIECLYVYRNEKLVTHVRENQFTDATLITSDTNFLREGRDVRIYYNFEIFIYNIIVIIIINIPVEEEYQTIIKSVCVRLPPPRRRY